MGRFPGPDSWSIWFDEFMLPVSLSAKYPKMRDQLQKGKKKKKNHKNPALYERLTSGEVGGSYSVTFCTIAEILLRIQNYFKRKIKKKNNCG